jgi:hypothetical protein
MRFLPIENYSKILRIKIKSVYVKDFLISTKVRPKRVEHLHSEGIISSEPTFCSMSRHVPKSKNLGGQVVMGGDNVPPLVEIGLTDPPKTGGVYAPLPPPLKHACDVHLRGCQIGMQKPHFCAKLCHF